MKNTSTKNIAAKNNRIFRKLIQSLRMDTPRIQQLLAASNIELSEKEVANLLKTDYEPGFEPLPDYVLELFLNNLIDEQRGKKVDVVVEPLNKHKKIGNNDVLKKLRVAFNLHEQDLRDLLKLVTIELTKSDLANLFRKAGHPNFKSCDDELLLDFIEGLGLWLPTRSDTGANHG